MSKVLTEEEKRRIAANRAEALRRAEERKKREALAAAAAAAAQKVPSAPQQLSRPVTHHVLSAVQLPANPVKNTPSIPQYTSHPSTSTHAPSIAAPSVTEFKPPTPARLPKSHVHVTFSVSRNDRIKIRFNPYHSAVTEAIKTVRSRTYDANDRTWSISLSDLKACEKTLKNLTEVDVSIESVPDNVIKLLTDDSSLKHPVPSDLSLIMDPALIECLFPFQKRGVTFGIERGGRLLLADEMGLGKSVQALTLARYYKSEWPLLIICPSSVKTAWKTQINKFLPVIQKIFLMEKGSDPLPTARTSNTVAILSYDLMVLKKKELEEMNYCVIIFDESHLLKDTKAKRTQVAHALAKRATRVILLSGTPALSRPAELFSQVRLVNDRLFPNFQQFAIRYCDGKQGRFCFEAKGCTNSEELSVILSKRVMIRRLKKDVLTDLPGKRREVVYLSGDKIDTCMDSLKKAKMAFEAGSGAQRGMGNGKGGDDSLLEYYSLTGIVKASAVCSHILDNYFYPDAPKRKVLIFAHHQIVLDTIQVEVQKRNLRSIRIDGQTSSKDRGPLCHDFQEDPDVQVAILSMTAAGVGITLTAASVVIFAELHWNPTTLQQAEDRAHRVGQKDSVFVQYLVARNTADDVIWPLIQHKLDDLGKVNLSGETFISAKRTHMKYETNVPQPKGITDFFPAEDEAQNSSKKAKWDE
uniref:SWI/SNF-related matrix-associated actin-dependent regulator of chromatin subfamily A-like protein 1 n=1 Tax=Haemonchus contortus TaxID=6289 RepID=A0A7I4YDZ1_HAECO|nr:SNF2-related and DNA RNA helicase domain containing protein [Haemonchus contortus]